MFDWSWKGSLVDHLRVIVAQIMQQRDACQAFQLKLVDRNWELYNFAFDVVELKKIDCSYELFSFWIVFCFSNKQATDLKQIHAEINFILKAFLISRETERRSVLLQ